jgi:hypothetical protein
MTPGIAALGQEAADRIIKTITTFDDFRQRIRPAVHPHARRQATRRTRTRDLADVFNFAQTQPVSASSLVPGAKLRDVGIWRESSGRQKTARSNGIEFDFGRRC